MNTREGHNTGLGSRHPRWCQENTQPTGQNPPIPLGPPHSKGLRPPLPM